MRKVCLTSCRCRFSGRWKRNKINGNC